MEPQKRMTGFNIFSISDEVQINRVGKNITIRGRDNTFQQSETVEANLLFEILRALRKGK